MPLHLAYLIHKMIQRLQLIEYFTRDTFQLFLGLWLVTYLVW